MPISAVFAREHNIFLPFLSPLSFHKKSNSTKAPLYPISSLNRTSTAMSFSVSNSSSSSFINISQQEHYLGCWAKELMPPQTVIPVVRRNESWFLIDWLIIIYRFGLVISWQNITSESANLRSRLAIVLALLHHMPPTTGRRGVRWV